MAITYPIVLPNSPAPRITVWEGSSGGAITESPFTGSQQVQSLPAERLNVEVEVPTMNRAEAEDWIGALLSLYGPYGTCLLGDLRGATPRGTAPGTPVVFGAVQTGRSLVTTGFTPSQNGILLPGDWIQIAKNRIANPSLYAGSDWTKFVSGSTVTVADNSQTAPDGIASSASRLTNNENVVGYGAQLYIASLLAPVSGPVIAFVWAKTVSGSRTGYFGVDTLDLGIPNQMALTSSWKLFPRFYPNAVKGTNLVFYLGLTNAGDQTIPAFGGQLDVWGAGVCCLNADARLHKVLLAANADSAGKATLEIYPGIRPPLVNSSAIVTANARGQWRLASPKLPWTIDQVMQTGLKFSLMEAY